MIMRRAVKHFPANDSHLFAAAQQPTLTPKLFRVQALTYRPLFLLGSLWLALVCASALAYHQLMFTEPPPATEPALSQAEVMPLQATDPVSAAGIDQPSVGGNESFPEASAQTPFSASSRLGPAVTLWGLMSLVGLCALGCFVISQQAKAMLRQTQRPKRRLKKRVKRTPVTKPVGPKRLEPYQPERDGVIVQGRRTLAEMGDPQSYLSSKVPSQSSVAPPNSQAQARPESRPFSLMGAVGTGQSQHHQPKGTQAPLLRPAPHPLNPAVSQPHQPIVVPEGEAHPLDWSEASIAHTLDLRQRHSLSSWL
jgi:hypothetical protein